MRDRMYDYWTTLANTLSLSLNPETFLNERLLQDIIILHLLYKILVKTAIWSWQRIDKYPKEEIVTSKAWVCLPNTGLSSYSDEILAISILQFFA
jgi:hypothetical protein